MTKVQNPGKLNALQSISTFFFFGGISLGVMAAIGYFYLSIIPIMSYWIN